MATKPVGSSPYAERLRDKGFQVSPAGMVRHNGKPPAKPRYNNWEKGRAGEHRPDGSFMPYIDGKGSEIPIKKMAEKRYEKDKAALQQARQLNTTR